MGASPPALVADLVERFDRDRKAFQSPDYKEEQLRAEFLNPLFTAFGSDMDKTLDTIQNRNREVSLFSHETARFLVDNQVSVSVSIDGDQLAHDERRKDRNGFGSFSLAVRGYSMLKQAGGRPGISCTPGNHNVSRLPEISAYFAKELKPEAE